MGDISNKTLALLVGVAIMISLVGIFSVQRGGITGAEVVSSINNTNQTGEAFFELIDVISITLDDAQIDLGRGVLAAGTTIATLESLNATSFGGEDFTIGGSSIGNLSDSFRLRNDGNRYVTLDINSSKNASNFVGAVSDGANFTFVVTNQNSTDSNLTSAVAATNNKLRGLFNNTIDGNDTSHACSGANQVYGFGLDQNNEGEGLDGAFSGRFDNYTSHQFIRLCNNFTFETTNDELDFFIRVDVPQSGFKGNRSTTIEFTAVAI